MNIEKIFEACDFIAKKSLKIAGTYHGSVWLADKIIRYFESEPAAESVNIAVYLNTPVLIDAVATIHRDGRKEIKPINLPA